MGDLEDSLAKELQELLAFESTALDLSQAAGVTAALEFLHRDAPSRLGRWQVDKPLGYGGMGCVYLVSRNEMGIKHKGAAKLGHFQPDSQAMLVAVKREAQALSALHHGGIARLLDFGTTDNGIPYVVSEYIRGKPFPDYVGPLNRPARLRLFLQLLDAVAAAHAALVLHLDIKPDNVLVTSEGVVKLIDFGLAGMLRQQFDESRPTGFTKAFASPEQQSGRPVTVAADIYSLGLVLKEVVGGPHSESKYLDRDIESLITCATASRPEDRYASVAEFKNDLLAVLENRPVSGLRDQPVYRATKFLRRQWLPVSLALLAGATLIGGFVSVSQQYEQTLVERDKTLALLESERATSSFVTDSLRTASVFGGGHADITLGEMLQQMVLTLPDAQKMSDRSKAWLASDLAAVLTGMGKMDQAMAAARLAVDHATQSEGIEDDIAHWTQLSLTAGKAHHYETALEAAEQARVLAEPINHWRLPWAYLARMQTLMSMKRWRDVAELWPLIDAIPTDRQSVQGNIDYMRGTALLHLGQFAAAQNDLSRALTTYNHLYGARSAPAADVQFRQFQGLLLQGDFADAELKVPALRELFKQSYGSDHYRLATLEIEFCRLKFLLGNRETALMDLRHLVSKLEQQLGPTSPIPAEGHMLIARILISQENSAEALRQLEAAQIRLEPLGRDHPDYAALQLARGEALLLMANVMEAEALFNQVVTTLGGQAGHAGRIFQAHLGLAQISRLQGSSDSCQQQVMTANAVLAASGRRPDTIAPGLSAVWEQLKSDCA